MNDGEHTVFMVVYTKKIVNIWKKKVNQISGETKMEENFVKKNMPDQKLKT